MKKKMKKKVKLNTFPKVLVSIVVIHGLINVDLSYLLAFLGRDTVSDVSVTLVTQVVAPIVTYLATNLIANIFEKNYLSFSLPKDSGYSQQKMAMPSYFNEQDNNSHGAVG